MTTTKKKKKKGKKKNRRKKNKTEDVDVDTEDDGIEEDDDDDLVSTALLLPAASLSPIVATAPAVEVTAKEQIGHNDDKPFRFDFFEFTKGMVRKCYLSIYRSIYHVITCLVIIIDSALVY